MDIGAGIAIAGAWIFVGMLGMSESVNGTRLWVGIIIATAITTAVLLK